MSEFDPRAYMNAQNEAEKSSSGFKLDGLTVSALLVMGLAGGLFGYNALMDFRGKNQAKLSQMMAEADIKSQEREVQRRDKAGIGGISLMANYANGMAGQQKMANDIFSQIDQNERLKDVDLPKGSVSDAKASLAYPKTNAGEYAKYRSTRAMIVKCQYDGYFKTRLENYNRQNADGVAAIKTIYKNRAVTAPKAAQPAALDELKDATSMIDVMKFKASGGFERHMSQTMGGLSAGGNGSLMSDFVALSHAKKAPRDYRGWSPEACTYLNQSLSNGSLNVKRRKA